MESFKGTGATLSLRWHPQLRAVSALSKKNWSWLWGNFWNIIVHTNVHNILYILHSASFYIFWSYDETVAHNNVELHGSTLDDADFCVLVIFRLRSTVLDCLKKFQFVFYVNFREKKKERKGSWLLEPLDKFLQIISLSLFLIQVILAWNKSIMAPIKLLSAAPLLIVVKVF